MTSNREVALQQFESFLGKYAVKDGHVISWDEMYALVDADVLVRELAQLALLFQGSGGR